jgi:tetratricopeptide (TPR) repeat protein
MNPVTVGLVTNLLAAGLTKGTTGSQRIWENTLRKNEFSPEIDAVETEFNRSLQNAIEAVDDESKTVELSGVEENWDEIVVQLYGLDDDTDPEEELEGESLSERLVFDNEEDAVEKIARAIADADGCDLNKNPQLERELKRAVSEAYREAVDSFGDRLVEAGLAQEFVVETNIEEIEELDRLQDRIEDLKQRFTQPKFYDLFAGDEEGRKRASKRIELQALEFVSRHELEESGECDRLLLLGPDGWGKSRALAELVATYDQNVQHVIVPRAPLQSPQDLQSLRNESFEGNVLLVWDDIHSISPETGNTIFRKAIDELEDLLDHDLHVLAAASTDQVESLPGNVHKTRSPLWSEFKTIELETLNSEAIEVLFDRVLADEGVAASEEVREAFLQKALTTDPSPLYVISVVKTAESEQLTMDDIEALPEDALAIWQDQYADIKAANDERRFVLWAVKFISESQVWYYYHSLLKGIYTHVLDRNEKEFGPPIEELRQCQWLVPTTDKEELTWYLIHDVKVKAIDEPLEEYLQDFSTFLFEEVDECLPSSEYNVRHSLHENCGYLLSEYSIPQSDQLVIEHYEQALSLYPDCATAHLGYALHLHNEFDAPEEAKDHYERAFVLDINSAIAHFGYALLLHNELDAPEEAKDHFERTLSLDPDFAKAHYHYAFLLHDEFETPEEARDHIEQALALGLDGAMIHYNYANFLNEEFTDPENVKYHYEQALTLDSDLAEAHTNYGILLSEEFAAPEKARDHYERALAIDPDLAEAHYHYAFLLHDKFDAPEEAKDHYERAFTLDPNHATAHYGYANILRKEFNAPEEARDHYERALTLDPDLSEAHTNYATFLKSEFDASEKARDHYEQALALNPNDDLAHYNYATLLVEEFAASDKAREHYEQVLELNPKFVAAHVDYATLLRVEFNAQKEAQNHYEQALALDPNLAEAHYNYATLLDEMFAAPNTIKHHYERAIASAPEFIIAHYRYARFLIEVLDAPEEARPHLETALRYWQDTSISEYALSALYSLIQVCRALDDEDAAIEYCEHAIDLIADTDLDDESPLWFESVRAMLTDTNLRIRYTYGLVNILKNDHELATELCEIVWTERDRHSPESDTYQLALSAGIALAASIQLYDDLDVSHTCDEILNTIDPAQLSTPADTVYDYLDTGTTSTTPDDLRARTTEADEEMTVNALEPRAFADLLERLENE